MNKFALFLLGALVALAASCTSPLTTLVGNKTPAPALGAHDAQLVFQASATESRAVTGDTYLTVQLKSAADGTVKFASATGANGTYTVTVGGMVAGDWNLKVMLYDSQASQVLKYYGNKTQYIAVGSSNNVTVPLYAPGTVNGVTFTDALLAHHVTITDPNGLSAPAAPQPVVIGTSWDLDAQTYSSTDDTTPATQPGVLWTSSDENVATVTANGRVFVQKKGTATITALSAENHLKTASYDVAGVPAVYGTWRQVKVNYGPPNSSYQSTVIWSFTADSFVQYRWSNEGDAEMVKGDYSYEQGLLKFNNLLMFEASSKTWLPPPPGELAPEDLAMVVSATSETLTMNRVESLIMGVYPNFAIQGKASVSVGELYMKVPVVPLTGITWGGIASGGTLTVPLGAQPTDLTLTNTPVGATITGLYWTTSDAAVFGYDTNNGFIAKTQGGPVTVTAYALNDLTTPVATYSVTVGPNLPPVTTLTNGPGFAGNASLALGFSDELGAKTGVYTVMANGSPWSSPVSFNVPVSQTYSFTTNLNSGNYTLHVSATDGQGNTSTVDLPFSVDAQGPVVETANLGVFVVGPPTKLQGSTITISDATGLDPATLVITSTDGYTVTNQVWDGALNTVTFDVNGIPADSSPHAFNVTAKDLLGNSSNGQYFYLTVPAL